MTFPAVDLLARVEAAGLGSDCFGGFDRNRVDTAGAGCSTTPQGQSCSVSERVEQCLGGSDGLPRREVVVYSGPWWEICWQRPPFDAVVDDVQDRVDDLAATVLRPTTASPCQPARSGQ